ncbi:response regulator transcription factor [bacterium]|nr:response regulator transcription factor [candidate division CSSED10-310 bacterium]
MPKEKIMIVDDDPDILELVKYNFEREGYRTITAESGESAIRKAKSEIPDMIILDLMLPGMDGLEVCRKIKQDEALARIPIIMLTAKSEESDIVAGLELGADDYIVKPFSPRILLARLRSVLRRRTAREIGATELITHLGITINPIRREVKVDGNPVDLTVTEFDVLHYLCSHPGWVFPRSQIINAVKGEDYPVTERSIDVQIVGLRRKLGEAGRLIETVRGVGYRCRDEA